MQIAGRLSLRAHTTVYGFEEVDRALTDLAEGRPSGSAVIDAR